MGILEIERTRSATGSDAFRAYKIFIDGNQVDEIKSGESKRIELSEGEHMLQLKIDWCTSKEVRFSISLLSVESMCFLLIF